MAQKEIPIPIEDAVTTLGVLDTQIKKWIEEDNPSLMQNHRGVLSVPKSYIDICANKPDYYSALVKAIEVESSKKEFYLTGEISEKLANSRQAMLQVYTSWVDRLEEIHKQYKDIINKLDNESWEFAAYILFSRAIALLRGAIRLLKEGYWYAGSIIREIDETLDVAQYLKITACHDNKTELYNWFRKSIAPGHSKCRNRISLFQSTIDPSIDAQKHEYLLNELYQKKSKWTHPNFGVIRESGSFKIINGKININQLCYGKCEHEDKLVELVEFFNSSIWTAYQQFMVLFADILSFEHREEILQFDKMQMQMQMQI